MYFYKANYNLKIFSGFLLLHLCFLLCSVSIAQPEIKSLRKEWRGGNYSHVLPLLLQYRDTPYGRNIEVDYMIATSACRVTSYKKLSGDCFNWILSNYSLDNRTRNLIAGEMQLCSQNQLPGELLYVSGRTNADAGVRGKTYYSFNHENALASIPVTVIREMPSEVFSRRLFGKTSSPKCISYYKQYFKEKFSSYATEHFVFISFANHKSYRLKSIGEQMEKVFDFYADNYGIPVPEYLITVFITPDAYQLRDKAEKLHGIRIAESSIGYSYQDDLSILGVINTNNTYVGTLAHELFHLMARNHFGDMPPWIDEGIASLYEVLRIEDNKVTGLNNWRGKVLKTFWKNRPSIKRLLGMNWESFEAAENEYEFTVQATNQATARYLILYLQEKGKLKEVYTAFQKRKIDEVVVDNTTDSITLLESITQRNISQLDDDFSKWFSTLPVVP